MDAVNSKLCTYRCYNSKYCLVLYISTFLISDLHIHDTIVWMKWEGLPIFFGMVTAAFEGIGLVSIRIYLIIENSKILVGLKRNFLKTIHASVVKQCTGMNTKYGRFFIFVQLF